MDLSQTNLGKTQTVSTQPRACTRCSLTEAEAEQAKRQLTEERQDHLSTKRAKAIVEIDLKSAHGRIAELETQIAAAWLKRNVT